MKNSLKTLMKTSLKHSLKSVRYNTELFLACKSNKRKLLIPLGSSLPSYKNGTFYLKDEIFETQDLVNDFTLSKEKLLNIATNLLETPYLWGGRNPMGIDCSGFCQIVYKCIGLSLHRDAKDQELQGEEIIKLNNAQSGDLAFFVNDNDKIHHVGLLHENKSIIHAAGKVRLDKLTEEGIFNIDKSIITHKLHSIKRFFMIKIVSTEQCRKADAYTIKHEPILSIDLMERAGSVFSNYIKRKLVYRIES